MPTSTYQTRMSPLVSRDSIEAGLIQGFRQARQTLSDLDKREARLFDDLMRGRGMGMFIQGCEIIRRSTCPAGRVVLSDHLRFCLKHGLSLDLTEREAFEKEMEANHSGDMAQWAHRWSPSRGSSEGVRHAMYKQMAWSEAVADVVGDASVVVPVSKDW